MFVVSGMCGVSTPDAACALLYLSILFLAWFCTRAERRSLRRRTSHSGGATWRPGAKTEAEVQPAGESSCLSISRRRFHDLGGLSAGVSPLSRCIVSRAKGAACFSFNRNIFCSRRIPISPPAWLCGVCCKGRLTVQCFDFLYITLKLLIFNH